MSNVGIFATILYMTQYIIFFYKQSKTHMTQYINFFYKQSKTQSVCVDRKYSKFRITIITAFWRQATPRTNKNLMLARPSWNK